MFLKRLLPYIILLCAVAVAGTGDSQPETSLGQPPFARSAGGELAAVDAPPVEALPFGPPPSFPALYRRDSTETENPVLGAHDEGSLPDPPFLANNQILAFYGHPRSRRMGILGEYSKEDLARLLKGYARLYDEANGPEGILPAYYLIYGTCWPGGEIGYLTEAETKAYIEYAAAENMLVFLDHQIGRFTVEAALDRLLPYLAYPNVHLALDPEWRTTAPMKEIGSITAEELNQAQARLSAYLSEKGLPGPRLLVVHQFKEKMIKGRERVRADYPGVFLIHTADGFGSPSLKRATYSFNAGAGNLPLKGFKLFFKTTTPGAGYDEPLLTPPEVLALEPRPALIMYQ